MHLAIFGQPLSGKSTVYEALSGVSSEPVGSGPPLASVKVPDARLTALAAMYKPKRTIPADVSFLDVRVTGPGFSKSEGLSSQYVDQLNKADALVLVV
ncbi:MAG: redox-regulated ATPase YchF, partial [Dehalococcoidia bacterium]|nr:redox-regulated ATPase YchF [Dehalococcoidia bacterium]